MVKRRRSRDTANTLKVENMISALDDRQSVKKKKKIAHLVDPQKESAPPKGETGQVKVCLWHREGDIAAAARRLH